MENEKLKDITTATGIIEFVNLETGFWRFINIDNDVKYQIIKIPQELKIQGTKARISYKTENKMSIFMTGPAIRIFHIHKIF